MSKRGKNIYVPSVVIDEVEDIKKEEDITGGSEALRKLVKHAQVGRELDRIRRLDFRTKPLPNPELPKRKKHRGLF